MAKRGTPLRPLTPKTVPIIVAARMLGVSRSTVYRDIQDGTNEYPVIRVRGRLLIPLAPFQRFLNGETVNA